MPCSTREVSRAGHSLEQIDALCDGLSSTYARIKYAAAKTLRELSERDPACSSHASIFSPD